MTRCSVWTNRPVKSTGSIPAVLVVDDNETSGTALAAALGLEAMDVRFAASGIQALEFTRHWMPDVIVLDINMPVHDGFSTAHVLRRLPSTRAAVIVAFTALDEREVRKKGIDSGFDGYCQKGRSAGELIGAIRALSNGSRNGPPAIDSSGAPGCQKRR